MKKVILTFDHDEHGKAEETVELEDAEAARLLREGNARLTPQAVVAEKKKEQS